MAESVSIGKRPINKIYGAGGGGFVALALAWAFEYLTGDQLPEWLLLGLATGLPALAAYMIPLERAIVERIRNG